MKKIKCACGCGELISPLSKRGYPVSYKEGHNLHRWNKENHAWNKGLHKVDELKRECYCCGSDTTYIRKDGARYWALNYDINTKQFIGVLCHNCWSRLSKGPEYWKAYHKQNRDHRNTKNMEYREQHLQQYRVLGRDYYYKNRDDLMKKAAISRRTPEARERSATYQRKYNQRLKEKLFHILGQFWCVRCGFFDKRALQFNHKNGGGLRDRAKILKQTNAATAFYKYYVDHPEEAKRDLEIKCANCNWIERIEKGQVGGYALDPLKLKS